MRKIFWGLILFFIFSQNLYSQTSEYKYDGQLKKGISHGQGTFTYKNGATCTGIWSGDFTGKNIECTTSTGRKYYEGELKNRKRDGSGTAYFSNGDKYIGQWKDNKKEGQGTYYFVVGNKYVGEFKDDKYEGQGTFYFENGNKYIGQFKDGKFSGRGTLFYTDGKKLIDTWADGKPINHEKKKEDKKYIYDLFNKAFNESEEARQYCEKIHTANLTIKSLTKLETCYADEKLKIYSKYNISYDQIVKILEREYLDLYENARSFVESVFLGSSSTSRKEKAYNDNIYEIRSRAQNQINKEAEKFASDFADLATKGKDKSSDNSKPKSDTVKAGSAFFINNSGHILTNAHVVNDCSTEPKISYNKNDYITKVIATDKNLDLALLKADIRPKNYLNISKNNVNKLDKIFVAGYPLGKSLSDDLKFTQGVVSSLKGFKDNSNEIQIDAAINPGSSGGPIVNEAGQLVAVAVSGLSKAQNVNFGIKSTAVLGFLNINAVKVSSGIINLDKNTKDLQKLLEESTAYIYCR